MSEPKWTPGPWEVFTMRGKLPKVREVGHPHGEASTYSATISEPHGDGLCRTVFKIDFGYGRKNAEAIADTVAAAPVFREALEAYELLDQQVANCEDHAPEMAPETCEKCFPFADDARLKMRAALAKARGEQHA